MADNAIGSLMAVRDAGIMSEEGDRLLRSGLKLQHMRMILALDEHGQISAAAHVLNISQPAAFAQQLHESA